jgi:hypothetical protein
VIWSIKISYIYGDFRVLVVALSFRPGVTFVSIYQDKLSVLR